MTLPPAAGDRVQQLLRQLNTEIQADPARRLLILREFYARLATTEPDLADVVLTVRSMVEAGEPLEMTNQTEHLKAGLPVLLFGMALGALASLAAIAGGAYAISRSASGATQMNLWGASISTQSVGVALVFLGIVGLVAVIRAAFKRLAIVRR